MSSAADVDGVQPAEGVQIRPLGIEKGSDRFSYRSDDEFPPQTASWRNNLIASSQRRNLLFAACSHQIYVWEPAGASQTLGRKPEMIITPVMKKPSSQGYIAPYFPHAINNMLVGDLGLEEVLLLVTDSGNVCGYRVEAIYSALERAAQDNVTRPLTEPQVHPFFVENVKASAWGLAIHKFSRQIAVSSNTGLITVFAFALVSPGAENLEPDHTMGGSSINDNDQPWYTVNNSAKFLELRNQMPDTYRMRNVRMTYTGHFTNIPSISFLNCDVDPNGEWMLSTDIDNKLIVWKVWESLNPCNVLRFNDSTFHFVPGMLGNEDRGWTVLALDPRTFRRVNTAEEACGGQPHLRTRDGSQLLDITKLTNRIPNASHLYNYFPPAVKTEPEHLGMPDIFTPDCRITPPSDSESPMAKCPPAAPDDDKEAVTSHAAGDAADNTGIGSTAAGNLQPSDSTDAFSHSAVDGSAQEGNPSQGISPDADAGSGTQQPPSQSAGNTGNGIPASLEDVIMQLGDHQPHTNGPLTAAEFLHLALIEGLGGEHNEEEDADGFVDFPDSDENDDDEMNDDGDDDGDYGHGDGDEGMDEDDDPDSEDGEGLSDHFVGPQVGTMAYNAFDRMFRSAFPNDPNPYGHQETLIINTLPPASTRPNFPILHFSQTDIRLIPHPFANHHTVVCYNPLRQPLTHNISSVRACDRFNMVQYIPEHGIVVAVSQKGRAAVITLTESEETGVAFRVDWIVPFESQEKYGERPLTPLLGMSVSPVQGFEMHQDVPYIPRGEDKITDLAFRYRLLNRDDDTSPDTDSSSDHHHTQDLSSPDETLASMFHQPSSQPDKKTQPTRDDDPDTSDSELSEKTPPTNAECHAWANRIYRPDEPWRGWNKSRHYRLFLMYADHTVMSYEFWYDEKTGNGFGHEGVDDAYEDPYLMI